MKKSILLKTACVLMLGTSILACKKSGTDESTPDEVKGSGTPTITIRNTIPAPMALTVNGKTDTLDQNEEKSFEGIAKTSLTIIAKSLAYKLYGNSIGTIYDNVVLPVVGEIVTLDLTATFPEKGTLSQEIKIPSDKYLVMIQNSTSTNNIGQITINYGLPSAKSYQFAIAERLAEKKYRVRYNMVINNGVVTPIGFFNVITPTSFYLLGSSRFWIYQNVAVEGGNYCNLKIAD